MSVNLFQKAPNEAQKHVRRKKTSKTYQTKEPATLRALRGQVPTCQRLLCAYVLRCQRALRACVHFWGKITPCLKFIRITLET